MRRTIVLGPQRRPVLDRVVAALDLPDGPVATVTAGWRDREADDTELDAQLGGRSVNLLLWSRWLAVLDADPEFAAAQRAHQDVLDELQELYLLQLDGALGAAGEIARRGASSAVRDAVLADAEAAVRLVDARHLARVADAEAEFADRQRPGARAAVARHRAEIAGVLSGAAALAVAGGHVGVLMRLLRIFAVSPPPLVLAWSAGAMALTERVLLFHDRAPHGPAHPEFAGAGLGLVRGCVFLPHPRRRLLLDDPARTAVLARRVAPDRCVLLDDGVRLDLTGDGLPPHARILTVDGTVAR
ncbi:hypothetical protein ACQEVB_22435 [Pseudonocardia sp. CA-107938]|uniref:hypothetical protein n=1 Tax=Pseudonocardia sp. CA-107938 TaxID=3240021 RepID=UPI003D8EB828